MRFFPRRTANLWICRAFFIDARQSYEFVVRFLSCARQNIFYIELFSLGPKSNCSLKNFPHL
jgi:hypothetical protein